MQTLIEIQAKIAELQAQEKLMRAQEYNQALEKAQELISTYSIAASDLKFTATETTSAKKGKAGSQGKKAPVKYRDENGNGWTGRGLKPKWLTAALESGKSLEDFAVPVQAE